ncbi:unnamed protein product [Moneuplotes crassus]|uniref:C3H1-type domain-containing protein n=1 Tax=Euplotes crassus TaxID=5936 RepID=A0AAD1TYV5_EUPCR|nr:unnamed protein product [Moneuplotes crassus]
MDYGSQRARANPDYRGRGRGAPRGRGRGFRGKPRGSLKMGYGSRPSTFVPPKDSEIRMYKVSLCKWIKEGKKCRNQGDCTFAHTEEERRKPHEPIPLSEKEEIEELYEEIERRKIIRDRKRGEYEERKSIPETVPYQNYKEISQQYDQALNQLNSINTTWEEKHDQVKEEYESKIRSLNTTWERECARVKLKYKNREEAVSRENQTNIAKIQRFELKVRDLDTQLKDSKLALRNTTLERNQVIQNLSNQTDISQQLKEDLHNVKTELENYKAKCSTYYDIIQGHQTKNKKIKEKYFKAYDQILVAPQRDYKKMFTYLVEKIESLNECPLSFESLDNPAILPSGNTINEYFCRNLIASRSTDPFDCQKRIMSVIVNRFAKEVFELTSKCKKKAKKLEKNSPCKDFKSQTDFVVRWEEDIEDNERLKRNLKEIENFYEKKLLKLTHKMHLDSFKFALMLINQNPTFVSLLLSVSFWHHYSKFLMGLYLLKSKVDLTTSYKNKATSTSTARTIPPKDVSIQSEVLQKSVDVQARPSKKNAWVGTKITVPPKEDMKIDKGCIIF